MIIMKKPFIKYLFLFFIFVVTIILVVVLNIKNSQKSNFLNYPTNYSLCNNNDLIVEIYCDRKDLSFFEKEEILEISITDEDENYYQIKIKDIMRKEKKMINNHNYYTYFLTFEIPFDSKEVVNMNRVKLNIVNKRGENIVFEIGNISMVSGDYFSLVDAKSITGMTKIVDNYTTLDKIKVELYNFQPNPVILKNVELISSVVNTSIIETKLLNDKTIELIIPINYLQQSFINNVGVILTWEYQGSVYQQLLNPYILFKTSTSHTTPLIQTYEVY